MNISHKKLIVISAINFTEGGPLTILNECLSELNELMIESNEYVVTAFVYDKRLCYYPNVNYIEIKKAKNSWIKRLHIEYIYFYKYSKNANPFLWLSLHDITPRVKSERRVTYFHNPSPFRKINIKDTIYSFPVFLFSLFYQYIYKINSHKNNYIIVQQNWLRDEFAKMLDISKTKIIVAYPNEQNHKKIQTVNLFKRNEIFHFFYPAFPRSFKNFEIICQAAQILEMKGISNFKISITLNGKENKYSKSIYRKFSTLRTVSFCGLLTRKEVEAYYMNIDCMIFPSLLETWGLPISEYSKFDKPILAANLPYAHETATGTKFIDFFNPYNPKELATKMELLINNDFSNLQYCPQKKIKSPFFSQWSKLFEYLLK